jgi:hypothetical protein
MSRFISNPVSAAKSDTPQGGGPYPMPSAPGIWGIRRGCWVLRFDVAVGMAVVSGQRAL